jgi:hypothetical protein
MGAMKARRNSLDSWDGDKSREIWNEETKRETERESISL